MANEFLTKLKNYNLDEEGVKDMYAEPNNTVNKISLLLTIPGCEVTIYR